jgi:hypothetical protein
MSRAKLALAGNPDFDYCTVYHCAGDCGLPHNSKERSKLVSHVLSTFDELQNSHDRALLDKRLAIERKAKKMI